MLDKTEMSLDEIIKAEKVTKKTVQPIRKSAATKGAASKAGRSQQQRPNLKSSAVATTSNNKVLKGKNRGGIIKPNTNKKNIKVLKKAQLTKQRNFKTAPRGNTTPRKLPTRNLQGNKRKPVVNLKTKPGINNRQNTSNSAINSVRPDNGAKLFISNLESGVTSEDMKELFEDVGEIKNAFVHYDSRGNSLRTANVNFKRKLDAAKAMKQYNGVALDGKPMVIQMISSDVPAAQPVSVKDRIGVPKHPIRRP